MVAHGSVPPPTCAPTPPLLLPGREPAPLLNLTILASGWTYSVSIPSAAPISAVVGCVRLATPDLIGAVNDLYVVPLRAGVAGAVVDMIVWMTSIRRHSINGRRRGTGVGGFFDGE
jgi:hypothetical protein